MASTTATKTKAKSTTEKKTAVAVKKGTTKKTEKATAKVLPAKEKKTTGKLPKITVSAKKKIIFLGSECAPFIATGGLADVLGSLPKALAKNKNLDVSVIIPLYSNISEEWKSKFKFLTNFNVSVSWRLQYAGVFFYEYQGVKFYFIDNFGMIV